MKKTSSLAPGLAYGLVLLAIATTGSTQSQDPKPIDSTVSAGKTGGDPDANAPGADLDDPTARLEWQRGAWGNVTSTFRRLAMGEGRNHRDRDHDRRRPQGPQWVNIGPTGAEYEQNGSFTGHVEDSGRVRTILPHPTDQDVVYVLTSGGGLWRTNNWTSPNTKWSSLTDELPTTGGGAVAFGRSPNTLYLGLGDPYDQILVGGAVVKSRNGGGQWDTMVELGSAVSVRDLKVDTSGPKDVVLVATDSGLYRSADSGVTYAEVPTFSGQSVWSLARTSAGWLVSAQPCPVGAGGLRCGLATTLYLSTDLGATWAPITNTGGVFSNNGRTTLGVGRPGDAVVYAYSSTVSEAAMQDVYRSADGGQTWVANSVNSTKAPTNPVPGNQADMNICGGQCWYNQMVLVDPTDPSRNTVWIGGNLAAAQTSDGGVNWTLKTWWLYSQVPSLPYAHADHHAAAFKTTGTPTLILGNDGGLNVSEDNGATFSSDKNTGLATHLYYTVTGNAKFPNLVLGGLQDNGTRLRTDNGTIHNQVIGGDGMGAAYSIDNTNTVMGSSQSSGIRTNLSNNPPTVFQNWAARGALSDSAGAGFFTAITPAPAGLDPTGKVFFHFTNSRVWRTNDGGLNWLRIGSATAPTSPGLPSTRRFRSSPYNLGVSPSDLNRIAVGAGGGFIDVTTDGGATWADLNLITLVPGYQGFVTNVAWQDNQTIWITSVAQATGAVRVIKASIGSPSASWATAAFEVKQTGLPDLPVTRVYFDPRDATKNTIFAATHVGIYQTTDGGATWAPYGNGLPVVRVNDIYMPPDGGFIRLATYGRGVWELSQVEFVSATLTDRDSCDDDDVLDNGEKGRLRVTLKNQGQTLRDVSVNVTSSNPHLTFPDGNVIRFEGLPGRKEASRAIRVALDGAIGVETADLALSISAPQLDLPGPLNVVSTHRVNYDDKAGSAAVDGVESANGGWTVSGDAPNVPNLFSWQRRALSPTNSVWWGPDNNGQADDTKTDLPDEQILTSPVLKVGSGPLTLSFSHRFSFESGGWDGGVIELSNDGGAAWVAVGAAAYNGATNGFTSSPVGAGRPAFVNRMVGWPNFAPVTLNLGTAYAGQDVQIRFRIGSDESTGAPGWDIDDIAVGGITNTPFGSLVPQVLACPVDRRHDRGDHDRDDHDRDDHERR